MEGSLERVGRRRASLAIVGRPNVGKSTLFNRLVGRRQSIVHNLPGVTRDRIFGTRDMGESGTVDIVDTGGLVPGGDAEGLGAGAGLGDAVGLNEQVLLAVEESDVLLLVVDGGTGLVPADQEVAAELRRFGKPTLVVVNKADLKDSSSAVHDFYSLGGEPSLISAEHGLGLDALLDRIEDVLPTVPDSEAEGDVPSIAIVGRPNVGKSSLLNGLLGDERALVSPVAGTTRDPVDTLVRWGEQTYLLVDTAGIRRRSQVSGAAEGLAVMMARRQIERAQLALLVIDSEAGVTSGDLAIAGSIWELGRCCVIVFNKWDLVDGEAREDLEKGWARLEEILSGPPRVNTSALTRRHLGKIFPLVEGVLRDFSCEVSTSELNRLVQRALERHHMPAHRGRAWKVYYASQVSTAPPTFMLFTNRGLPVKNTFRRYLENAFRRELDLPGVPIRLVVRRKG